jgi:hypothetical protein
MHLNPGGLGLHAKILTTEAWRPRIPCKSVCAWARENQDPAQKYIHLSPGGSGSHAKIHTSEILSPPGPGSCTKMYTPVLLKVQGPVRKCIHLTRGSSGTPRKIDPSEPGKLRVSKKEET